jgi:hypothetical protein
MPINRYRLARSAMLSLPPRRYGCSIPKTVKAEKDDSGMLRLYADDEIAASPVGAKRVVIARNTDVPSKF